MTRFARAKGSKASNERVPETSTPWHVMKQDLERSQNEIRNQKDRAKMNQMRQESYNKFLDENDDKSKKWAEFPQANNNNKKAGAKNKKNKPFKTENDISEEQLNEMIDNFIDDGGENNVDIEEYKSKIENALSNDKKKKNQKTNTKQEININQRKGNITQQKGNVKQQKGNITQQKGNIKLQRGNITQQKGNIKQQQGNTNQQKGQKRKIEENESEDEEETDDIKEENESENEQDSESNENESDSNGEENDDQSEDEDNDLEDEENENDSDDEENKNASEDEQNNEKSEEEGDSNSDEDMPEEMSVKEPPKEIVVKKAKNKKQKLVIAPTQTNNDTSKPNDVKIKQQQSKQNKKSPKNNSTQQTNNQNPKQQTNNNNQKPKQQQQGQNKQAPKNDAANQQTNNKNQKPKQQGKNKQTPKDGTDQQTNDKNQKRKLGKVRDDRTDHKRRKPLDSNNSVMVNGVEKKIHHFDGFPVLAEDRERLIGLRRSLNQKGIPMSEIKRTLQMERRKSEKHLSRLKKVVCFNCRCSGHLLSECPELNKDNSKSVIDTSGTIGSQCFKCGSTEHKSNTCTSKTGFKFAQCFICRESGHIARECPDNPRGLYPDGGACKLCGAVTHLKKDCLKFVQDQQEQTMSLSTITNNERNIEGLEDENINKSAKKKTTPSQRKNVVKF